MVHHADVHRAVATLAALAAGAHTQAFDPNTSYAYRILNAPTSSDERAIKNLGLQPKAQQASDRLFSALSSVLGGSAPKMNFVASGSPLTESDFSATPATNTVNVDPLGSWSLIDAKSPYHNAAVVDVPHEMAHLRQTLQVLADAATREGSAQAFADLVTPASAQRAQIAYVPGNYDGTYAAVTKQAQARGTDWLLGGQFGHAPVAWP